MALYKYNDVVIQEPPAGLIDDTYKYAMILAAYSGGVFAQAMYIVSQTPSWYRAPYEGMDGMYGIYPTDPTINVKIGIYSPADGWVDVMETPISAAGGCMPDGSFDGEAQLLTWANFDIPNGSADSSDIYLTASEPELYFPKMYRYGDVLLPEFPNGYPDDTYKHATIISLVDDGVPTYALILTTTPCYTSTVDGALLLLETDPTALCLLGQFVPETGCWVMATSASIADLGINLGAFNILWTNTDILSGSPDSTEVYYAGSDQMLYDLKYYQYNDAIAAELPLGYPNAEYPYMYIVNQTYADADMYALYISPTKFYTVDSDGLKSFTPENTSSAVKGYVLGSGNKIWSYMVEIPAAEIGVDFGKNANGTTTLKWSNVDVPDGSVDSTTLYLAASEPVEHKVSKPIPEVIEPTGKVFKYGDVILPEFPSDILEDFPYRVVYTRNKYDDAAWSYLAVCKNPIYAAWTDEADYVEVGTVLEDSKSVLRYTYNVITGSWEFVQEVGALGICDGLKKSNRLETLNWSNSDIYRWDFNNNVSLTEIYFKASEPVLYEPKYKFYRGMLLPELPSEALESHPYCIISNIGSNSQLWDHDGYIAYFASSKWYLTPGDNYDVIQPIDASEHIKAIPYDVVNGIWGGPISTIEYSQDSLAKHLQNLDDRHSSTSNNWIYWSNTDIPNGSSDATDIYLEATEAIDHVDRDSSSYYNGALIVDYPSELHVEKPYALIVKQYISAPAYNMEMSVYILVMSNTKGYVNAEKTQLMISGQDVMYGFNMDLSNNSTEWLSIGEEHFGTGSSSNDGDVEIVSLTNTNDGGMTREISVVWSNYDLTVGRDGSEIYLAASNPISENQRMLIKYASMMKLAEQARKFRNTTDRLGFDDILSIFKNPLSSIKKAEEGLF